LFGESHLQAFRAIRKAKIAAIYDNDPARAITPRIRHSHICGSLAEICAPPVGAIDVVTPEELHLGAGAGGNRLRQARLRGKTARYRSGAVRPMIAAAQAAGRILMVGQILRFETKTPC
jgi:predicted dehydrogenase